MSSVRVASDATDGIDATATPLPGFPRGLVIAMNSGGKNFMLFNWDDIAPRRGSAGR